MADIADLADDDQEVLHRARLAGVSRPARRRVDFCDCSSWSARQQFCGDTSCRDAYEAEERCAARAGGRVAVVHLVRRG
jgi:hypothetical protein